MPITNILDWNIQQGYAAPNSYPQGFIGPTRPGDYVGGVNPYNGTRDPNAQSSPVVGGGGTLSQPTQPNPGDAAQRAAQEAAAAALQSENTAFDYNKAQLEGQLGSLGGQKDRAITDLDLGLSGVKTQVGQSRDNSQTNTDSQIRQAGSVAHTTQQQNRNVLRALGIINSSAGGELLSKPINEFDKQRATLTQALGQRFNELDSFLDQKVAEANNAKNGIIAQFTDLTGKIQTDLRFNERQRLDAVRQANAALQQRLADIQNSVMNFQQQVAAQKNSFATGLQEQMSYQDPTYNKTAFNNQLLTTPQNQVQTVGLTPSLSYDPTKKKVNNGLLGSAYA